MFATINNMRKLSRRDNIVMVDPDGNYYSADPNDYFDIKDWDYVFNTKNKPWKLMKMVPARYVDIPEN